MKKLSFLLLFIFIASVVFAQNTTTNPIATSTPKKIKKDKGDRIVLDIFSDLWQGTPSIIEVKKFNPSANVLLFKDFPITKSPVSFAVGLGFDAHNFNSNGVPVYDTSLTKTFFVKLSDTLQDGSDRSYTKNKMTVAYLDLPVEVRFRTMNETGKKFKFAIGFKAGILINKHTKYKGKYFENNEVHNGKTKSHDIKGLEDFRYGITARVGYGMYNLMFYYSLTSVFAKNKGPQIFPVSVGISLTPFN